jgi:hypothetical protein
MTTLVPTSSEPLGFTGDDSGTAPFFNVRRTVLSQYANSPIMLAIIDGLAEAIELQPFINDFILWLWDIDTAQGFGLDVWGRIVGVQRSLYITDEPYLGFSASTDAVPFGQGAFYNAARISPNFSLSNAAYRQLIMAKAALNISNSSIPAINAILRALFPDYGNVYVRDNGDMTMTYVFGSALSKIDYAIVTQSGVLPRPAGVSVTVETP